MALARFFTLLGVVLLVMPFVGLAFGAGGDCFGGPTECQGYWQRKDEEVTVGLALLVVTAVIGAAGLVKSRLVVALQFAWAVIVALVALNTLPGQPAGALGMMFPLLLFPIVFLVGGASLQLADDVRP